ncbi:MAG: general secretion pathway protein GspL [Comamonadaceae bacterium]|nr:MAG: general secretion pathway protein GspL [Comamonadaceae bacterium]
MTTLIVTLPLQPAGTAPEYSYVLTPDGRTLETHASAAAALLPQPVTEVIAVAPARALSWHRLELPKGSTANAARLRAVLEGLLEERLLDDPQTLHFALEPGARTGTPAWVAVCDRAWLRDALQALETPQRHVSRIVPEFAPDVDGAGEMALHVIGEPQDAWLVTTHSGGVIVLPMSASALPLAHVAHDLPEDASVIAEPGVAAVAEQLLQRKVTIRQAAQRQLLAAQSNWDLAQFDFATSGGSRAAKKFTAFWRALLSAPQWRAARWGAAVLVVANLLGLNAWAWKEETALAAKRGEVRNLLTQAFPEVKVIVDAPAQMERQVAALRQATGAASGSDLESMLGALSVAAPAGKPLTGIEFSAGESRLKGLNLSAQEQAAVASSLRTQGYSARVEGDSLVMRQEIAR